MAQALIFMQLAAGLLAAAPQAAALIKQLKDLVDTMFSAGVINAAQQNALKTWIDSYSVIIKSGIRPDWWKVGAEPIVVVTPPANETMATGGGTFPVPAEVLGATCTGPNCAQ